MDPIRLAYMYGPSALGMWQGAPKETVCSASTGIPASFWTSTWSAEAECDSIVERKLKAIRVTVFVGMYCMVAYKVTTAAWTRRMLLYPILDVLHDFKDSRKLEDDLAETPRKKKW
mgnify:FL=1